MKRIRHIGDEMIRKHYAWTSVSYPPHYRDVARMVYRWHARGTE